MLPVTTAKRHPAVGTALLLALATTLIVGAGAYSTPSIADAAAEASPRAATSDAESTMDVRPQNGRHPQPPIAAAVAVADIGPGDLPTRRWLPATRAPASLAAPPVVEAAVAVAPAPVAEATLVALPLLFADVWNAEERYFAISGASPGELIASAKAAIPSDPNGVPHNAVAYSGPVAWDHVPSYVMDPSSGACSMTGVTTTASYQATLPQWTSPSHVAPELLVWWQAVLEQLRQHEGHHVSIYADFVADLRARAVGQSCDTWVSIATQWSADLTAAHAAFDAQEAAWVFPSYAGPP